MWKTLSLSIGVLALLVTSQASGSITYDYYVNGVVANGLGFQAVISDNSDNPSIATNEVQITLTNKRSVTASVYGQYFNIASSDPLNDFSVVGLPNGSNNQQVTANISLAGNLITDSNLANPNEYYDIYVDSASPNGILLAAGGSVTFYVKDSAATFLHATVLQDLASLTPGSDLDNAPFDSAVVDGGDYYGGTLAEVPEPSAIAVWSLLGASAIGLGWLRRRKAA